jgi:CBS domain-containing protein
VRAKDIMTEDVVTVCPETSVSHVAQTMLKRRLDALPVLDDEHRLVGIVSKGDLVRRAEGESAHDSSSWLVHLVDPKGKGIEHLRVSSGKASDIMTRDVVVIDEDMPLAEIASLLQRRHIKRAPVMRHGRLVGIVSRADLLRVLAGGGADEDAADDDAIRSRILSRIKEEAGVGDAFLDISVSDGTVHLWGGVESEAKRRAVHVAAQNVDQVRAVVDHLQVIPAPIGMPDER